MFDKQFSSKVYSMHKMLFAVLIFACAGNIHGATQAPTATAPLRVFAVPGQNGLGSGSDDVALNLNQGNTSSITAVATPTFPRIDLGQSCCVSHLAGASAKVKHDASLIHATSQGTATALRYAGSDSRVKGLVLESVMASGNSAIQHTVRETVAPAIANLPLSYYWLPYVTKVLYPLYWPAGQQGIKSVENIPTTTPVVIVHSTRDFQLSHKDACAVYYRLRERGVPAYLISPDDSRHVDTIRAKERAAVQEILGSHGLIPGRPSGSADLSRYQPDHRPYKQFYQDLIAKERNHTILAYSTAMAVASGLAYKYREPLKRFAKYLATKIRLA